MKPITFTFDARSVVLFLRIKIGPGCWKRIRITGYAPGNYVHVEVGK